jgi:hypothetical protein
MRKIRNPRYAPESLERKLSPSALIGQLPTVLVSYPSNDSSYGVSGFDTTPPVDPPTDPMPNLPTGPVGPA